jgi:hypothetical protein
LGDKKVGAIFIFYFGTLQVRIRRKAFETEANLPKGRGLSKKNQGLNFKKTLANFKKCHFFQFIGDVPKIALAIYMRGDKKS